MQETERKPRPQLIPPERRARDWVDTIPDPEDDRPSPYEPTYRDGTVKNECWDQEDC